VGNFTYIRKFHKVGKQLQIKTNNNVQFYYESTTLFNFWKSSIVLKSGFIYADLRSESWAGFGKLSVLTVSWNLSINAGVFWNLLNSSLDPSNLLLKDFWELLDVTISWLVFVPLIIHYLCNFGWFDLYTINYVSC